MRKTWYAVRGLFYVGVMFYAAYAMLSLEMGWRPPVTPDAVSRMLYGLLGLVALLYLGELNREVE